jgi:hypothetical protein
MKKVVKRVGVGFYYRACVDCAQDRWYLVKGVEEEDPGTILNTLVEFIFQVTVDVAVSTAIDGSKY